MTKLKDFLHKRPSAWYMLYIPVYLLLFFIVEQLVPSTCDYWVSYLPLDDLIPFCEYFVIFYCLWYPLLIATAIYLLPMMTTAFGCTDGLSSSPLPGRFYSA